MPFGIPHGLRTPFLWLDVERVIKNVRDIQAAFPRVEIFYSVKCNPDGRILAAIASLGVGFEIASPAEARLLIEQGVPSERILCLHPIKSPEFLRYLHSHGITTLAADSFEEIDKIAEYAPGSRVVARIFVHGGGSGWDLSGKFGLPAEEAPALLLASREKGLKPYGITMHVGSQCACIETWKTGFASIRKAWKLCRAAGLSLKLLSLGGGLPAQYRQPIPDIGLIGGMLNEFRSAESDLGTGRISIEPGRAVVASAGILVTTVIGVSRRGDTWWAYLDAGTYNGLVEAIETRDRRFYPLGVEHENRPERTYHLGGPTCAGLDTPFRDVRLPELRVGERVYVFQAGAYTSTTASPFNGFPVPRVHHADDWHPFHDSSTEKTSDETEQGPFPKNEVRTA